MPVWKKPHTLEELKSVNGVAEWSKLYFGLNFKVHTCAGECNPTAYFHGWVISTLYKCESDYSKA